MEKKISKKLHKPAKISKSTHAEKVEKKTPEPVKKYIFAVGRRKTSTARVKVYAQGTGAVRVNGRDLGNYFPTLQLQKLVTDALDASGMLKKVDVVAGARGGGINSQAKAVQLGIARALVKMDLGFKSVLKKHGFMTRDSRKKERKKPGLKRARRAPQWQKR